MKKNKIITWLLCVLAVCFLAITPQFTAFADNSITLDFVLTSEGKSVVYKQTGDEVEVSFVINRTDSDEDYTLSMFQNVIRYDVNFFELVENSIVQASDCTVRPVEDAYGVPTIQCSLFKNKEFPADAICTFKLKVIAESGFGFIDNGKVEDGINNEVFAYDGAGDKISVATQSLKVTVGEESACTHTAKTPVDAKQSNCAERGWKAYILCNDCGAYLAEDGQTELADVPYIAPTHSFSEELSFDWAGHWFECTLCGEKGEYSIHAGGTATCEEKAICSTCNQEYGSFDEHNHSSETVIKNQKITWFFGNGYSGDVHCADCGEMIEKGETISMYDVTEWPLWVWVLAILFLPVVLGGWGIVWMLGIISTFIL